MEVLFGFVGDFWASGVVSTSGFRGNLAVIPKKGDNSYSIISEGLYMVMGVMPKIIVVLVLRKL